ncbi:MAG TPA: hypothetical protein VN023_07080 [Methylovorus sp.]|jgi:hypothetical protein|nr:hypothetical protein [Methylovorus sp.]
MQAMKTLTAAAILTLAGHAMAAEVSVPQPRAGQWSSMVAILDHLDNHYLIKTGVYDDVSACSDAVQYMAGNVNKAGGFIWTNRDQSVLEFEATSDKAPNKAKVLELRCVLEPFSPELVKKY